MVMPFIYKGKIMKVTPIILALSLVCTPFLFANEHSEKTAKNSSGNKTTVVSAKIFNAYCPATGGKVDPKVKTVTYKGKTIGFCCSGCDKTFLKDPEKALKNLSKDGQKWISNQKQQAH
jgi:YHS domain-containing protein